MSRTGTAPPLQPRPAAGWLGQVLSYGERNSDCVLVTVVAAKGSTPRNVGARMIVTKTDIWQTIGGGALEFDIMARAREMLGTVNDGWQRQYIRIVLGPDMGQCCGGSVSLLLERFGPAETAALAALDREADGQMTLAHPLASGVPLLPASLSDLPLARVFVASVAPQHVPLFIYGAGHVSRALLPRLSGLGFDIFLVDVAAARFPDRLDGDITKVLAKHPATIASRAPASAAHLVMTHSHALDETICQGILSRGEFGFLGLIGSVTKRARFVRRMRAAGIPPSVLDLLVCPVGIGEITGKAPAFVALSIAAQLAIWRQAGENTESVVGIG